MSWIDIIDEDDAEDQLEQLYSRIAGERGKVSNIMRSQSLNPEAMEAHLDLYLAVMFDDSGLSREEREIIAVAVSATNDCEYCIEHHARALMAYWNDRERIDQFVESPVLFEDLDERQRALVDYALQITERPSRNTEEAVAGLREIGLEDDEILAANLAASYFNFVNRIALGLGVELTEEDATGYEY